MTVKTKSVILTVLITDSFNQSLRELVGMGSFRRIQGHLGIKREVTDGPTQPHRRNSHHRNRRTETIVGLKLLVRQSECRPVGILYL